MTAGFGEPIRDPAQAQTRIDQWAQGFAEKARRYETVRERTEELRLSASSADGAVTVTVRADGSITDLRFGNRARTVPFEELSGLILSTMHRAQAGIADRVSEVMTEQLGDEDQQTRSLMLGNLRERFPDPEAEEQAEPDRPAPGPAGDGPSRPEAGDDEENNPW